MVIAHLCTSQCCSGWNYKVPYSMPNFLKKKEQNKRNYIESQESKKAAARSYSADTQKRKRLPPVLVIMLVLRRKGQPPVPVIGLPLSTSETGSKSWTSEMERIPIK